jgi:hypothetical protein
MDLRRQVIDIFGIAAKDRHEISVLSDELLDSITERTQHPNVQVRSGFYVLTTTNI